MREPQRQISPWFANAERTIVGMRLVEVGVGEDDVRVLAAQLERELLEERARPSAAIVAPVAVPPVNEIARTSGCVDERRAGLGAEAVDDVEHARRQPDLGAQLGEQRCAVIGVSSDGLATHGVAGRRAPARSSR